ncbi:hypothetical protein HDK77DRAFT_266205 [Phyllosticta capitalensis]
MTVCKKLVRGADGCTVVGRLVVEVAGCRSFALEIARRYPQCENLSEVGPRLGAPLLRRGTASAKGQTRSFRCIRLYGSRQGHKRSGQLVAQTTTTTVKPRNVFSHANFALNRNHFSLSTSAQFAQKSLHQLHKTLACVRHCRLNRLFGLGALLRPRRFVRACSSVGIPVAARRGPLSCVCARTSTTARRGRTTSLSAATTASADVNAPIDRPSASTTKHLRTTTKQSTKLTTALP